MTENQKHKKIRNRAQNRIDQRQETDSEKK